MKKLVCCGLSALLSATMSSYSSSPGRSDGDRVELTFWRHQNRPWAASYQKIARELKKKNPDTHINIEFFPYDQFESRVRTFLISGEGGADIYELRGGWGLDFASTGALAEIPENLSKTIHGDVYPSMIGALGHEGKLCGLPMRFNAENDITLVNKKSMNEHNLKTPTAWKELRETAKKAMKKDGDTIAIKGFDFVNWDSVPYMFLSMILSTRDTYQNENGNFNLQTPQIKAVLQELYDMMEVDGVMAMEGLDRGGDMEGYWQLYARNVTMAPRSPRTVAEGITSFGLEYGRGFDYVSMPWFGDKPAFVAGTEQFVVANGNSRQQEAAFKSLGYFFQDDVPMKHNAAYSQIPPKKSAASDPGLAKQMSYAEPLIKVLDKSQFIGHFNIDQLKGEVNTTFQELVRGDIRNADQALVTMEKELSGIMRK